MPFDASLVLHDGTAITADKTPTSTDRVSGSVCIDLGAGLGGGTAGKGSGIKELAAVLIDPDGLTDTDDTVAIDIQACATVDGTYVTIASFTDLNGTGFDVARTEIIRFSVDPKYRYIRAYINITDNSGSDFSEVLYVMLTPHAFYVL